MGPQLVRKAQLLQAPREKEQQWKRGHKAVLGGNIPQIHGPEEAEDTCGCCHKFHVLDLPLIKSGCKFIGKPDGAFWFSLQKCVEL